MGSGSPGRGRGGPAGGGGPPAPPRRGGGGPRPAGGPAGGAAGPPRGGGGGGGRAGGGDPRPGGGEALDAHTRAWAERVNRSGAAYLTPAVLGGRWVVRVSVGAETTTREDVEAVWAAMRNAVTV